MEKHNLSKIKAPVVTNIVVHARVRRLNLLSIVCKIPRSEITKYFAAAIVRSPRILGNSYTFLIYENGNIVLCGCKNKYMIRRVFGWLYQQLFHIGIRLNHNRIRIRIQNIVAPFDMGNSIRISELAQHENCHYEPELFPGAHLTLKNKVSAVCFNKGKVNLIGAKTMKDVDKAFKECVKTLLPYLEND